MGMLNSELRTILSYGHPPISRCPDAGWLSVLTLFKYCTTLLWATLVYQHLNAGPVRALKNYGISFAGGTCTP